jgi:hypothetical protein
MDDEELYVPDDVLEWRVRRGTKCCKKSKLRYQKELEKFTSERKTMSESEVKRNLHPLVTMDTDSHSRE